MCVCVCVSERERERERERDRQTEGGGSERAGEDVVVDPESKESVNAASPSLVLPALVQPNHHASGASRSSPYPRERQLSRYTFTCKYAN